MDIEPAPKKAESEWYSGKWENLKGIDLDEDVPEKIRLKKSDEPLYYHRRYSYIHIIRKVKKEKQEKSPYEIEQNAIKKAKKEIGAWCKDIERKRRAFILCILNGKIQPLKDDTEVRERLWTAITSHSYASVRRDMFQGFFLDKESYEATEEEKQVAQEAANWLNITEQMLIAANECAKGEVPVDYGGCYMREKGWSIQLLHQALALYGFSLDTKEEEQIIDGTHELYRVVPKTGGEA